MAKYDIGTSEDEFEQGSSNTVLSNKLGIDSVADMNDAETELLLQLYEYVLADYASETLTIDGLATWHRKWLGNVYEWAGAYRTVNMGKGGFEFAAALQIPKLLEGFENNFLSQFPRLSEMDKAEAVTFLAQSHVEFILIHPFREGNGRLSRLLLDYPAVNAGLGSLDYQIWDENKKYYFKSIQAGFAGDTNIWKV
jgi:cell filamentation protein